MRRKRAERELTDRILSGVLDSQDLPPEFAEVARRLAMVRPETRSVDPSLAEATVAAMSEIAAADRSARRVPHLRPKVFAFGPRIAAAGFAAALLGGTSLGFAGALPGPAQDAVHNALSHIGVSVPRAHHATPTPHPSNKGETVSGVAHSTSPDGGKGDEVSKVASDGRSHAGEDRSTNRSDDNSGTGNADHGDGIDRVHVPTPHPQATPSPQATRTGDHGRDGGSNDDGSDHSGDTSGHD